MSAGNEQELLDEIQFLTKLIKSHSKASNKAAVHKRPSTSVGRSTDVYRWTNRATKGVTESPKALHHNAAAETQAKIISHRHPPPRKGTRQGRFVYTPKDSLNKSKHYCSSLLPKVSALERSAAGSSGGHQAKQQSGSQFVYYGKQSTTQPTIVNKESKDDGLSSKPPEITSHAPESKSPTGYPSSTCTAAKDTLVSDSQTSCSVSGNSDSRKRKRTVSAHGSRQLTKRPRSQHSSVLKSSRYVWLAKSISHKYKSSSQMAKQQPLNRSQFKWRVSTNHLQSNEPNTLMASPMTTTDIDKLPTASGSRHLTPIHKTTPLALSPVVGGVISKPASRRTHRGVSGGRTLVNSKYKWRRRLSSSGSKKVQRTPTSPLVVQSRYKLTRASLLERRTGNPFRKRLSSFTQRRVNYILRNSPHTHTSKQLVIKGSKPKSTTSSKNKVWIASSGTDTCPSDAEEPAVRPLQKFTAGRESKTRQGNKQWVASGISKPSRSVRSAQKVHTKKQPGLRTPTATSSRVVMDASGRRMIRIPSSSRLTWKRASVSGTPSINRMLARNAVRRSRAYVWNSKQRNKLQEKSKQYCMFFNRFGKCNKMATCPFIHDPDKVAVCTKFLRGMCDRTDGTCLFSHKISKEKMPVCSFFLRGVCTKDNCPYVHVSVGKDAEVCQDFLRGYCPSGEQCTKLHTLDCPEFSRTGSCSRGSMCSMRHSKRSGRKHLQKGSTTIKEPFAFRKVRHKHGHATSQSCLASSGSDDSAIITPAELDFIPLDRDYAPDFIAL